MLADAFDKLSPRLATHYTALLARELVESPELASLHDVYTEYAKRDRNLPRPVLAYFGYHAFAEAVDFTDVDHIGEGLLIPQLLRDVLAIVGATLAGHAIADIEPAVRLLLKIGTASQVVDDIAGTFPGVIDHDKDTLGEIANLRRTVPLVLLATGTHRAETTTLLMSATPLSTPDAKKLRDVLWNSDVPARALTLSRDLFDQINADIDKLDRSRPRWLRAPGATPSSTPTIAGIPCPTAGVDHYASDAYSRAT